MDDPATDSAADTDNAAVRQRIGVVRNPRSHRNRGSVSQDPHDASIAIAVPVNRAELAKTLKRFAEQRIELLVVDGGDGTMRDVLTGGAAAFGEDWPDMLVLPKGKTNALAVDLGMPSKMSLTQALQALPQAHVMVRRPLLLERQGGEARPVLGFIMGTGMFDAAIAAGQVAHRFGAFQGFAVAVTALFGVIQGLFGFGKSPWRALYGLRMRSEGGHDLPRSPHAVAGYHFAAGLSTLGRFPLGMKPFASADAGIRYLLVDAPLRRVIALVPAILMGLNRPFLQRLGVHRGAADALDIELDESFILDGEAFPPGRYRLRLGPELRFLVP